MLAGAGAIRRQRQLQLLAPLGRGAADRPVPGPIGAGPAAPGLPGRETSITLRVSFGKRVCGCFMMQREPGPRGSRINFVHPKDTGGVLIELVESAAAEPAPSALGRTRLHATDPWPIKQSIRA